MKEYYEHLCACGCGGRIEIKKHHKYYGVPKYCKSSHTLNVKNPMDDEYLRKKCSKGLKKYYKNNEHHNKGKKRPKEVGIKISNALKGRLRLDIKGEKNPAKRREVRRKISKALFGKYRGEESHNWKPNKKDRSLWYSAEYQEWRTLIFKRDNYKCQMCYKNGYLQAHHIFRQRDYPDLIFKLWNGITLCKECHLSILNKEPNYVSDFLDYTIQFEDNEIQIKKIISKQIEKEVSK